MSEATQAAGIQGTLQALSIFDNADVTIDDWDILDGSLDNAPFAIISVTDNVVARFGIGDNEYTDWQIPIHLFERFEDWQTSRAAFRDTRQAVIDALRGVWLASGTGEVREIRNVTPVGEWFSVYVENVEGATPDYVYQMLMAMVREREC